MCGRWGQHRQCLQHEDTTELHELAAGSVELELETNLLEVALAAVLTYVFFRES